jgi:hypothetical protein
MHTCGQAQVQPLHHACLSLNAPLQLLASSRVPALAAAKHFVNLTNGIEAIGTLDSLGLAYRCVITYTGHRPPSQQPAAAMCTPPPPRPCRCPCRCRVHATTPSPVPSPHGPPWGCRSFVRLTSTACEQQHYEKIMAELDANLLVTLALGHWWVGRGCRREQSDAWCGRRAASSRRWRARFQQLRLAGEGC